MPPTTTLPLSPAELSYLRASLSHTPPLRPDGRSPTQFRPLVAETNFLPSANGSARVCFADGSEAVVGVQVEVERSSSLRQEGIGEEGVLGRERETEEDEGKGRGREEWVEVSIEIPGARDDDALPVFLAAMLSEALRADRGLGERLWINERFHWRVYVDVLLLSQALSYPLPLLSLTTHLALLSTRIPAMISEKDEDPLFNDDWEASHYLYPQSQTARTPQRKPPVTLLVISVDSNIIFDPSKDELAVADAVLAISIVESTNPSPGKDKRVLTPIAIRTIDPPSRLTGAGVPTALNTTAGGKGVSASEALALREVDQGQSVWRPPRGGVKRSLIARMVKMVVEEGGVGKEVLGGLAGVEI